MPRLASLHCQDLVVDRAGSRVLHGVSLDLLPGHRLGIVGPNGAGKSTLLLALAGLLPPTAGAVSTTPPDATVGYLAQEPERPPGETVADLLARRTGVRAAEAELEASTAALADGAAGADDRYAAALDRWLALGAADLDARLEPACAEVGLSPALLGREAAVLSGGEAAKVGLAAVLLSRFDVLLLDEPTNDLDFDGLDRLEAFVVGAAGAVALVSHDRAFLDRTVTDVVDLDPFERTASHFGGGFAAFLEERATARRHAEEAYERFEGEREQLRGRAQREREWSSQGAAKVKRSGETDKFIRHFRTQTSEQLAGRAARTDRALERLERDAPDKPWEPWQLDLHIAAAPRAGSVVARLEAAEVDRGGFRLGPVDLEVAWGDRVAIVGPNGAGKSTLLAALLGRVALAAGSQHLGPGVVVGEVDQARDRLALDSSLERAFLDATGLDRAEGRSLLAKFGLSADHVDRAGRSLSPGERTRAVLALLMASGVNTLVLDEPTNHLDLPAIEQLEAALDRYDGTLLLVSHDRRLLDAVRTTRTLDVAGGQVVERR